MKGHLSSPVLWVLLLTIQDIAGVDELRLADGGSPCAGRVEVKHNDQWGTVCDDGWDIKDAGIVCKELGCGHAASAPGNAHFGRGSGRIWLNNVACDGTESALWRCGNGGWGSNNCGHGQDAGVTCAGAEELRLVNGGSPCAGRVEVKHQDQWGMVCDDDWDMADARIVCKQLGCGDAVSAPGKAHFGRGSGRIWLNNVACDGTESVLWLCRNEEWGVSECDHGEDAGVTCTGLTERTDSRNTAAPSRRPPTDSGRVTVPVVVCIILGALLCLVLIILGAQMRRARAQRRGSRRPLETFPEAVYEEIDYNLMREKQEMFSRSVSNSDDSVTKLKYYTRDSEGENDPGSEQEGASPGGSQLDYDNVEEPALNNVPQTPDSRAAPAPPGDVPGDGYDEAREESDSEGDPALGQNDEEGTGANDRDSQTSGRLHSLRSEVVSGLEMETPFPLPGDTGYDDVGHGDSGGSIS